MNIKSNVPAPRKIIDKQIPANIINETIRSIWLKKCEQEASEKGILACEAKVRVVVYLFYQRKKPKPRIFIETIRPGDLVASHDIALFDTIQLAQNTFDSYATYRGVTPKTQSTPISVKSSFEVIF